MTLGHWIIIPGGLISRLKAENDLIQFYSKWNKYQDNDWRKWCGNHIYVLYVHIYVHVMITVSMSPIKGTHIMSALILRQNNLNNKVLESSSA